jgi:hypothetical protein
LSETSNMLFHCDAVVFPKGFGIGTDILEIEYDGGDPRHGGKRDSKINFQTLL